MELQEHLRREALASAIEDERLLVHEYEALSIAMSQSKERMEARLRKLGRDALIFRVRQRSLHWESWLAIALNAHNHNLRFYEQRLAGVKRGEER